MQNSERGKRSKLKKYFELQERFSSSFLSSRTTASKTAKIVKELRALNVDAGISSQLYLALLPFFPPSRASSRSHSTQQCAGWRWLVEGRQKGSRNEQSQCCENGLRRSTKNSSEEKEKNFFFSSWFIKSSEILFPLPYPVMLQASAAAAFSHPHSQLTEHNPSCSFIFVHSKLCFFLLTLCLSPPAHTAENDS